MARTIDDFWKILAEIQGESTDLTEAVKAIAQNEKTTAERLFGTIIDQPAFNSQDYQRLRSFLRDLYAAHRSVTSFQANISDVYQMPNDQLDDLFQSFGYDLSSSLKNATNNEAPLNKVNFFLDLVNLYKIKGTPQAVVDVLQYYGIVDVDLYESTMDVMDNLFENLQPGGVVMSHELFEQSFENDQLKRTLGPAKALYDFFIQREIPYRAMPLESGSGLVVPTLGAEGQLAMSCKHGAFLRDQCRREIWQLVYEKQRLEEDVRHWQAETEKAIGCYQGTLDHKLKSGVKSLLGMMGLYKKQ